MDWNVIIQFALHKAGRKKIEKRTWNVYMILKEAKNIAVQLCYQLQPYCVEDKINIAGGIRRKKPDPHDIELILLPKTELIKVDLFENQKEVRSQEFINVVNKLGENKKGNAKGKQMQIMLPENIMLDLFMPEPHDYFRQYAIRTGNFIYSQKVLAIGWNRIGWVGSDKGLRKKCDCIGRKLPDGKMEWKCINPVAEKPPLWPDEKEFFRWLGVRWIEPEERNMNLVK